VPLIGVDLDGIGEVTLGSLSIRRPSKALITQLGVEYSDERLDLALEQMKPHLWMMGAAQGTAVVSKERFVARCKLACGLLAIVVASMYERGAHGFRIGVITTPEEGHGRAISLSWTDAKGGLSVHSKFVGSQPFKINAELGADIGQSPVGLSHCEFWRQRTALPWRGRGSRPSSGRIRSPGCDQSSARQPARLADDKPVTLLPADQRAL
jgi:hypothetical protein